MINEIKELMTKITPGEWTYGSENTNYPGEGSFCYANISSPHKYKDKNGKEYETSIITSCGCCEGCGGSNINDLKLMANAAKYIKYLLKKLNEKSN